MTTDDGYLSRNKQHLARMQRQRRAGMARIDYMPGDTALAVIDAKRETLQYPETNSSVIDAIVSEWAALTGIKYREVERPKTSAASAGIFCRNAHAYDFGAKSRRVTCGAKRHRDGKPCQAKSEPGKRRCRFHGGRSTGPRTAEGKARALANLRQNRPSQSET